MKYVFGQHLISAKEVKIASCYSSNVIAKSVQNTDLGFIQSDIQKGGEGSRGGKIIGRTKSGKPIYDTHSHSSHKDFSKEDHGDAASAHDKAMSDIGHKPVGSYKKKYEKHENNRNEHHKLSKEATDNKTDGKFTPIEFSKFFKDLKTEQEIKDQASHLLSQTGPTEQKNKERIIAAKKLALDNLQNTTGIKKSEDDDLTKAFQILGL